MAIRPEPVTPNGGVPVHPSGATGVDGTAVRRATPQSEGNSAVADLATAMGQPDARFTVSTPQAADAKDLGDIAEGRSTATDGAASVITSDVVDAEIERVFWPQNMSYTKALQLISLLKPESARPIKLKELADRITAGFARFPEDKTPDRTVAYERLATAAHKTLRESAQGNRDDYAKAYEAIARMTRYLSTREVPQQVHLWVLYQDRGLPPVNVALGARAALAVLDERFFSETARTGTFRTVLAKAEKTYGPGEREPLLMAIAENLDKCPMSRETKGILSGLVEFSQQESESCKAKVEDAVKKYSEAHGAGRGLLGLS